MNALRRWAELPAGDRMRLLLMMAALPLVSFWLQRSGYQRTRRMVDRFSLHPRPRSATGEDLAHARHLAWLANVAGRRGPFEATCLRQSLLVYGLLRRRGLSPELKLGVHVGRTGVDAHAWVELDGHPLEALAQHFQPLGRC